MLKPSSLCVAGASVSRAGKLPALWVAAICLQAGQAGADNVRGDHAQQLAPFAYERWLWHPPYPDYRYSPGYRCSPGYWHSPGYWYSPCYPFASCATLLEYELIERRLQRLHDLRRGPPQAAPPEALPFGPPGPESELQPGYRDSGKIRPEFEASGQFRPEFLEERGR